MKNSRHTPLWKLLHWHGLRTLLPIMLSFSILFHSCAPNTPVGKYKIGFSQCMGADQWRKTMLAEMRRELSFHDNVELIFRDAEGNSDKQNRQINDLVNQKIDLLIVSPNEVQPLSQTIEKVYNTGIPVVVVDRRTNTNKYTAFIGAGNFEVGQNAGRYAVMALKGRGNIMEVTGLPDASPVIDRHNGFMNIIANYPQINFLKKIDGDWEKKSFNKTVEEAILSLGNINLVFAQNDRMAFAVYNICKKLHLENKIKIIGIDGLPQKGEGLDMVENKNIAATVLYPTGGQEAILTAVNILEKKPYKKENQLLTTIIDSSNVRIMKLQNKKVLAQQEDIDNRQKKIEEQVKITHNQTNAIYGISFTLLLTLTLGSIVFYSLRENRKINKKLQLQNLEILEQKNKLEELSAKAQAANEAKVKFFTNISHEFRTPLTLILGPLEELLGGGGKNQYNRIQNLNLIHKNVIRLLRLINQLMDFRKIEVDKMKLKASENELVSFVSDIIDSYKSIAHKRNIDLRLITNERQLTVWFDVNMLDKVVFNLLSNAFKFTKDDGYIHVYINKSDTGNEAVIKVEDNGIGMNEDVCEHAFELFYQGEYDQHKGSGLGLALSKELIKLHKGSITVNSKKWKGTTFEITLPLEQNQFAKQDLKINRENTPIFYEDEKVYRTEIEPERIVKSEVEGIEKNKDHSILLIEDNDELRTFLKDKLQGQYEIIEANDGQSAIQQAFDTVPDLIISDVVIPGKDGLAVLNIIKGDIRTSHIPIILLSGKTSVEHQVEGMKNKADAYVTKPFHVQFLEHTIQSLLSNRAILKEHFTSELPSNLKTQTVGKLDKKFVSEFTSVVESNLSNEEFAVEDICKALGVSRVQLYRKVKALLNINVNDYILNCRLQKAKYLLQHEELTISEIAYKVGFSSPAYFSTVFKSKFGVTPKAFKEK